jgi:hypothetical protein
MAYVIVLVLLVGVVLIVTSPWRERDGAAPAGADGEPAESPISAESAAERRDLEAARDAKYREIRDAELDHQTGKLSDQDYEAIDSTLRAEAIELLRKLDALDELDNPTVSQ